MLSLTACGAGITLAPGVAVVVLPEMPWTPAMAVQAEDRAHRIGATRPVECFYLLARGSFDEDVFAMLERKAERNASVLDASASAFVFE